MTLSKRVQANIVVVFIFLFSLPSILFSQQTINKTLMQDTVQRNYTIYVPSSYNSSTPAPFNLPVNGTVFVLSVFMLLFMLYYYIEFNN